MSRKAIKTINWAALAERIPQSEKGAYAAFKGKSDQYLQRMMANPESPPVIDWAYYKKNITSSNLVDKFQKEYETLSIPYPTDKYTAEIDAEQKKTAQEVEMFVQKINESIAELQAEADRVKNMLPVSVMTMEDYVTLYPNGTFSKNWVSVWPHTPDAQYGPEDEKDENGGGH